MTAMLLCSRASSTVTAVGCGSSAVPPPAASPDMLAAAMPTPLATGAMAPTSRVLLSRSSPSCVKKGCEPKLPTMYLHLETSAHRLADKRSATPHAGNNSTYAAPRSKLTAQATPDGNLETGPTVAANRPLCVKNTTPVWMLTPQPTTWPAANPWNGEGPRC